MPRRRNRKESEESRAPRPFLDMLICAMCGAPVPAQTPASMATCPGCGHRTTENEGTGTAEPQTGPPTD
jgi:rubrerythrin